MIEHSPDISALSASEILAAHAAGLIHPGQMWFGHADFPRYLIGSHGAVLSFIGSPRVLRPIKRGAYDGYTLKDRAGRARAVYRHRLVAEVIHGPAPDGAQCCHRDGNRANADCTNLRWDAPKANAADKRLSGTHFEGDRHHLSKLTSELVREMRYIRATTGASYKEIAKRYGVTTMTAHRAINGKLWRSVQ